MEADASVKVYDPIAMNECKRRIGDKVVYATDMYDAVLDADALLLVTEWKEFRMPSWGVVKKTMRQAVVLMEEIFMRNRSCWNWSLSIIVLGNKETYKN